MDPRSDLFALGLVMLEIVTGRGLYGTLTVRASDLEEALTPDVRAKVVAAHNIATLAELPEQVDDYILRAAMSERCSSGARSLATRQRQR